MVAPEKVFVTKKREVHTYAELWHASSCTLAIGQAEPKGSTWQFLSSAVLTAFAFEAYLNHVGSKIDPTWEEVESLRPAEKLDHLCKMLSVNFPDGNGRRPLQTISELFDFRNSLAHGKTETVEPASVRRDNNDKLDGYLGDRPLTHWERLVASDAFAVRAREDVKAILEKLHACRPEPKEPLLGFGVGISSGSMERQN